MTDDDWAPLPAEELCQRPGEHVELPRRAVAPSAPMPPAAPVPPPLTPAQQREAERALAALQAKLAHAAPATSFVAEVQHREQRAARKQLAAHRADLEATLVTAAAPVAPAAPAAPEPAAPKVEYDPGRDGRDEREESEWYRGLPPAEQQRLRAVWAGKRALAATATSIQRRLGNRRLVAALVVFAAVFALGSHVLWHATLGAGVVCGLWWRHSAADRFLDPVRAVACFFALQSLAMVAADVANPALFMDSVFVVAFAALVGFDGEIRRTGGFVK